MTRRNLEDIQASITAAHIGDRPEIVVNDRFLRDLTEESLAALAGVPGLYQRAGLPVRLENNHAKPLTHPALKGELERAANFVKETFKKDEAGVPARKIEPSRPPGDVVADILALPPEALPFPPLNAITPVPVVTRDGRLHLNGYDDETGILVTCSVPDLIVDMPAAEAVALLDDAICDFPFVEDAGRAHWYAMTLLPVLRHVIDGATPLHGVEAPTRGMGKGLLVDASVLITTGTPAPIMPNVREADEMDKRILTLLLEGHSHVVLDNVTSLRSAVLAAAITSEHYRGRILGKSESTTVPNHVVWILTGNNPDMSDELARRIMPIRVDAGMERPENRTGFKHPRLKEYIRRNRPKLLSAVLSIVNAWVLEGMPHATRTLGSFEAWAAVMGGVLDTAGIPGLLGGREHLHELADSETRDWAALLEAWHERYGPRPITAGELFHDLLKDQGLLLDVWGGRSALAGQQRLGHALKARRDRVFGRFRLRAGGLDGATRNAAYFVEPAGVTSKHPKHPEHPETPLESATSPRVFSSAGEQNTRETPQNTRAGNPAGIGTNDEETGVSGVSGVSTPPPAKSEQAPPPDALHQELAELNLPTWWATKATAEPEIVRLAIQLAREAQEAGTRTGPSNTYLVEAAARLAGEGQHRDRRTPPPGIPL